LALEEGLDLSRLADAGHPQPYHVKDLDTLRAMRAAEPVPGAGAGGAAQARHLTAEVPREAFSTFAAWAADHAGLSDAPALLAGLAGGCLDTDRAIVAYEAFGRRRLFHVPRGTLSAVAEVEEGTAPDLILRDLRTTRVIGLHLGPEDAPTLTLTLTGAGAKDGLSLTLECAAGHLSAPAAVALLADFAGRLDQPIRHLL
jgi:pyruvate dehydrogenase E2 component (dihydrolipoamide acetyltransferase)/2-oxoglutarate dehydrogenase E2 component (dihydrolipoamide succinyltransferase)